MSTSPQPPPLPPLPPSSSLAFLELTLGKLGKNGSIRSCKRDILLLYLIFRVKPQFFTHGVLPLYNIFGISLHTTFDRYATLKTQTWFITFEIFVALAFFIFHTLTVMKSFEKIYLVDLNFKWRKPLFSNANGKFP